MGFFLYNMVKADIYDPTVFERFEEHYKMANTDNVATRHCFGGLYACYKSNLASSYSIDYWISMVEKN